MRYGVGLACLLALLCSCGPQRPNQAPPPAPAPPPPLANAPSPPATGIDYQLPAATPATAAPLLCPTTASPGTTTRTFDFNADPLYPLADGPRLRASQRQSFRRTRDQLREAVKGSARHLRDCYRWIRYGGRREVAADHILDVDLTIDAAGAVIAATARPRDPRNRGQALASCAVDGLRAVDLQLVSGRVTRASGTISFGRSGLKRPPVRPRRPSAPTPSTPATTRCEAVPADLPVDELDVGTILVLDDWDKADHHREEEARIKAIEARGETPIRYIREGCTTASANMKKSTIRQMVRSNVGAYRDCYRAALADQPGLTGQLVATMTLRGGKPVAVQVRSLGAPAFEACMQRALRDLAIYPGYIYWRYPHDHGREEVVSARYAFDLQPQLPPAATGNPLQRGAIELERLNGGAAAEAFAEAIRRSAGGPDECEGRVGVLAAMLSLAPLPTDSRVASAAGDLARYAASDAAASARADCLKRAAELTAQVARWPGRQGNESRWPYLHEMRPRIAALLDAWPTHPGRVALLRTQLLSLQEDGRRSDAADRLATFVQGALTAREASETIELATELGRYDARTTRLTRVGLCN